jgi:hypothetical protein
MLSTLKHLYPTGTTDQIERNQKALIRTAIANGYTDEDTYDSEGMEARYQEDEYQDYKNEAVEYLNSK